MGWMERRFTIEKKKKKRERERKEGIVEIVIKFETNGHTKE